MNSISKIEILELTKSAGALETFLEKIYEVRELFAQKKKEWEEKKAFLLSIPDTPENRMLFDLFKEYHYNVACELERQEKKWQRLKFINSPPPLKKGAVTEEMLEVARFVPFSLLLSTPAKRVSESRDVYLCPFHNESTPSFTVYKKENNYHCFGCQVHGDTISYVMKTQTCSFKEAVLQLVAIDKSL